MFYRETGQFHTTYAADMAVFPIRQDRVGLAMIIAIAAVAVPLLGSPFFISSVMIPFLVFSLATIGLNILTGYTGLISLGTGAFMGVGAYACFKLTTLYPHVNIIVWIFAAGLFSAAIGALFGLPSLRVKGFYLAVTTLAAQFFLQWCFVRIPWLYNDNSSGSIEVAKRTFFDVTITGPESSPQARYLTLLGIVIVLTWIASNIVHGRLGRSWMAVRDMDIAAELMGIRLLPTKLIAFAVSSYYAGVSGACLMYLWYGGGEAGDVFNIDQSFNILFMVILGGLGSLVGSFFGAAFISILPTALKFGLPAIGVKISGASAENMNFMAVGALIIFFLIAEPAGLARLWQIGKEKLRLWPFPY